MSETIDGVVWNRTYHQGNTIVGITRWDGKWLEFDPPNIIFLQGGELVRVAYPMMESAMRLEVWGFGGDRRSYRMRIADDD